MPERTVTIRPLRVSDASAVIDVVRCIVRRCNSVILTLPEFHPTIDEEAQYIRNHHLPGNVAIGAVSKRRLVGVLFLSRDARRRRAHVGVIGISVASQHRNQGIGQALLRYALRRSRDEGVLSRIELSALANNPAAIHIFEKAGFQREGIKRCSVSIRRKFVNEIFMALNFANWLEIRNEDE